MSATIDKPIMAGDGKFQIEICCFQQGINAEPLMEQAIMGYGHLFADRQYSDRYSIAEFIAEISEHSDPSNQDALSLISSLRKCF